MLQDLDDSMLVMDRFLDSELLESLDQLMVHAGTQQVMCPHSMLKPPLP